MEDKEVVTAHDIFKEITKIYSELGKKLSEFDRMMAKAPL
jgi:hypothetical protein